jgi:hypothetical protein
MESLDVELESQMLAMIDGVLAGRSSFHDFAQRFYRFVTRDIPVGALSERGDFFDDAQEKLDDVSWAWEEETPITQHDRESAAITRTEYLAWLGEHREAYRRQFGR